MQNALKKKQTQSCSQFELTTELLRNLYKFKLTPVTKLVLLELTTHMNESKNGSVVFPSIGYIAEVLGIGLTAAKKAINDLIKEGLIIKSKRDKVSGNRNKYLLTPKVQNMTFERSQNELFKQSESDLLYIRTNNNEKIKQQRELKKQLVKICTNSQKEGGNVYLTSEQSARAERSHVYCERNCTSDDEILRNYAIKHGADNENRIRGYVNKLKETKSAEKIIKEYNKKNASLGMAYNYNVSQNWLQQQVIENQLPACTAQSIGLSLSDLKKRGIIK